LLPGVLFAQDGGKGKKKVDFATQIYPILEKRCVECHATAYVENGRTKKPKGGVVLDSKDGITTSKRGKLVVAGKAADSILVESICLPADDEDRMPPPKKGDPLSKEQIDLIKSWIDDGAEFGKWNGKAKDGEKPKDGEKAEDKAKDDAKPKAGDKPAEKPKADDKPAEKPKGKGGDPIKELLAKLRPLHDEQLAALASGPFTVRRLEAGSPLLVVSCAGHTDTVDDQALTALLPIAEHIVDLDLGRSKVSDQGFATLAKLTNLLRLDLRQTTVGNGVAALVACPRLESLNLFGTKVTDYGMAALGNLKNLQSLYVWQTEVSARAVMRLREQNEGVRVVVAPDLPEPMTEVAGARRR
jgi:hypothetical protein